MKWNIKLSAILFIVAFLSFTLDYDNVKFLLFSLVLYSLSIYFLLSKVLWLQLTGIWTSIFLITQTLITPLVIDNNYKTLQPDTDLIVDVKSGYPGIQGKQKITTDSYGFRTTKKINYESEEPYRIFAIGGSTTEEIRLDDTLTWTARLQLLLQSRTDLQVEVVNTGVAGLRAQHHLSTLNNILKLNPDLVVFLVGINDWNWHIKNRDANPYLLKIYSVRKSLVFSNTIFGRAAKLVFNRISGDTTDTKTIETIEDHGEYYNHQRGSLNRLNKITFEPDTVHDQYKLNLGKIAETCINHKIDCMFISQPSGYSTKAEKVFLDSFWMTPPNDYGKKDANYTLTLESMIHISSLYNDFLLRTANENGIFSCDLASKIDPGHDNFYDDCHFNTNGANNVALNISQCISEAVFSAN